MTNHIEILRSHNIWRRGGDGPQTDPMQLGAAIDATIAEVEMLRKCLRADCSESAFAQVMVYEVDRLRDAIVHTLNENGHLADGENCTLIALKRAVPEWELPE